MRGRVTVDRIRQPDNSHRNRRVMGRGYSECCRHDTHALVDKSGITSPDPGPSDPLEELERLWRCEHRRVISRAPPLEAGREPLLGARPRDGRRERAVVVPSYREESRAPGRAAPLVKVAGVEIGANRVDIEAQASRRMRSVDRDAY